MCVAVREQILRNLFFPSTTQGVELGSLGLAASAFLRWVILSAQQTHSYFYQHAITMGVSMDREIDLREENLRETVLSLY